MLNNIGLISQALSPYVKSVIGIDSAQAMVDEFNKKVWQQGINENEMKAICLELKESEGDQLNGRKFDLIVVSYLFILLQVDSFFKLIIIKK